MRDMSRTMTRLFTPARRRVANPDYLRFRRLVKAHGLKYQVTRDNYLEVEACPALPRGLKTAHLDWSESASRVELCIRVPESVDQDGYYAE